MTLAYLGEMSIGATVPGAVAALNLAVPNLTSQISALVAFQPVAINFATDLQMAGQIVTNIQVGMTMGITPPSISAQIAIVAGILAGLQANLAAIQAFQALLSESLFAYGYSGATNAFGGELSNALASGFPGHAALDSCHALVLGTTSTVAYNAMGGVFVGF